MSAEQWARWSSTSAPARLPPDLLALVRLFDEFERTSTATHYETVVPSRRALLDLAHIAQRFESGGFDKLGVERARILDRAVAGRVLPRVRGEHRRLKPLLESLSGFFNEDQWPISGRHVRSMLGRTEFGFVSFWA